MISSQFKRSISFHGTPAKAAIAYNGRISGSAQANNRRSFSGVSTVISSASFFRPLYPTSSTGLEETNFRFSRSVEYFKGVSSMPLFSSHPYRHPIKPAFNIGRGNFRENAIAEFGFQLDEGFLDYFVGTAFQFARLYSPKEERFVFGEKLIGV